MLWPTPCSNCFKVLRPSLKSMHRFLRRCCRSLVSRLSRFFKGFPLASFCRWVQTMAASFLTLSIATQTVGCEYSTSCQNARFQLSQRFVRSSLLIVAWYIFHFLDGNKSGIRRRLLSVSLTASVTTFDFISHTYNSIYCYNTYITTKTLPRK